MQLINPSDSTVLPHISPPQPKIPGFMAGAFFKLEGQQWLFLALPLIAGLGLILSLQVDWSRLMTDLSALVRPETVTGLVTQADGWGPLLYIAIIIVSVVVSQIPGAPLAVAAGAIWDPLAAGAYTMIGGFGGALIAYGLGRLVGPAIIKTLTGKSISFVPEHRTAYLGWFIFVTRLLPIFSFDLVSYGAGLTRLSFPVYASATFFGMMPSTLLLTYMGGNIHLNGGAIATLSLLFLSIFVGLPALLHRFNWLNISHFICVTE